MGYKLRSRGFSRVVCNLSQDQLDHLRTSFLLTGDNNTVEMTVETYKSDFGESSYLPLDSTRYLEGRPAVLTSEKYERIEGTILPVKWIFNITTEIPF